MKCALCEEEATLHCRICGKSICGVHVRIFPACATHKAEVSRNYSIYESTEEDRKEVRVMVKLFWGEPEQLAFGQLYLVESLPAFLVKSGNRRLGFLSYAERFSDLLIVAIGVLPKYQGIGVGKALMKKIEEKARVLLKKRLLVSVSNDNLFALSFYQSLGFRIFEIKQNAITEKHGGTLLGVEKIPVNDELRLEKNLTEL